MGGSLPASAGSTGLIPGPGRYYRPQGDWTRTSHLLKPACPGARTLQWEKPLWWEACVLQSRVDPACCNQRGAQMQQWRLSAVKNEKWSWRSLSPVRLFATPWTSAGQNTGVGSRSLLQGIFPTQGLNPGLLHCRWILYQLSHQGSPVKSK